MRDYIYISRAKVDLYVDQIPEPVKKRFAFELGVNLGILRGTIKSVPGKDDSLVPRLLAAEKFIEAERVVKTLETPKEWVRDMLDVRHILLEENPNVFMIIGRRDNIIVLLAGSAAHVVGTAAPETVNIGASYLPFLAKALEKSLSRMDAMTDEKLRLLRNEYGGSVASASGVCEDELASMIYNLWQFSHSIEFRIEFLGRELFTSKRPDEITCCIISPLYVQTMTGAS